MWAVGAGGTLLHFNGTSWTKDARSGVATNQTLFSVRGLAQNKVWATGTGGVFLSYDGTTWSLGPMSGAFGLSTGSSLWASSAGTVWVAGNSSTFIGGGIGRFDGAAWTTQNPMTPNLSLQGIWGSSDTDLWAVSAYGAILNENYEPPIRTYTDPRMEMSCKLPRSPT